jgi:hypothetical protein
MIGPRMYVQYKLLSDELLENVLTTHCAKDYGISKYFKDAAAAS